MAKEYKIDATGKKLGRLASEVAVLLIGKNDPTYAPNKVMPVSVEVTNSSKLDITDKKLKTKLYKRYSGYPGGLKEETGKHLSDRKGYSELVEKAVYGMLPGNRLRSRRLKNLKVTE